MNKIYLGKIKKEIPYTQSYTEKDNLCILDEDLWFEKHNWDCGWYWGFGYIGNSNLHTHSNVFIEKLVWNDLNDVFEEDNIFKTNDNFWIFKDLLIQAYALSETAKVYKHGGYCVTKKGITDIIINKDMYIKINKDLEKILNKLWVFLKKLKGGKNEKE